MKEPPSRALAVWLAVAMALPTVAAWLYFVVLAGEPVARWMYLSSKAVQFALPVCVLWKLYGWTGLQGPSAAPPRRLLSLALGAASGLVIGGAGLGLYFGLLRGQPQLTAAAGPIAQKMADFGIDSPGTFLLLAVFLSGIHSWLEEYYWRWFVFARLTDYLPAWLANLLSSLAFAAHHVIVLAAYFGASSLGTALGSLAVAIGGALWAWQYRATGSLTGPWLSHLLIDAAIMAIGYDLAFAG
jgi:membrane protease YdiL (CAAX protease family)